MFSELAKKHAEACRYCWMCRHLCPIGLVTGKEANTPRGKGLLVSMYERGFDMDSHMAEIMYECLLCYACVDDCKTGFEPPIFIREGRTQAVINDLVPAYVQRVIDAVEETGNMFGRPREEKWELLRDEIDGLPENADVLLYVGNTAAYKTPEIIQAVKSLLSKAGVAFTVLKDEPGSGIELGDLIGFVEEVRGMAKVCAEAINSTGAKTVVVIDTYDAVCLKHEYPIWGCELEAEVVTATSFIADLVKTGKLAFDQTGLTVTYHEGARRARNLYEHEPARELLAAMGANLKEMFLNRNLAKDCGSELVTQYHPELMRSTAKARWAEAQETGADVLVTACPQSYTVLSRVRPDAMELKDIFVLLNKHVQ